MEEQKEQVKDSKELPKEASRHPLKGEWMDFREFPISGDLLVIYQIEWKHSCFI